MAATLCDWPTQPPIAIKRRAIDGAARREGQSEDGAGLESNANVAKITVRAENKITVAK